MLKFRSFLSVTGVDRTRQGVGSRFSAELELLTNEPIARNDRLSACADAFLSLGQSGKPLTVENFARNLSVVRPDWEIICRSDTCSVHVDRHSYNGVSASYSDGFVMADGKTGSAP